jgi:hypothetical protein
MKLIPIFLLFFFAYPGYAQKLSLDEINSFRPLTIRQIDSLLRNKGFSLLQNESDTSLTSFYYNSREKDKDDLVWIRSFSLVMASHKGMQARLLTYRTYNQNEYRDYLKWLAENNYKTTDRYNFEDAKHTLYIKENDPVRVIQKKQILPNGREIISYEFELAG